LNPTEVAATTTIRGAWLLSPQPRRSRDRFDLALSLDGIEIQRPHLPVQHMSWSRVSTWEIEERKGFVLLTLRGDGATTFLVVPGWTLDDLEVVMRDVTGGTTDTVPDPALAAHSPPAAHAMPAAHPAPATHPEPTAYTVPAPAAPVRSRSERRRERRRIRTRTVAWKTAVTVVLLGVVATAVTLVLLQSAGIIDWGFLGPTA
jgi:hypothetical protein